LVALVAALSIACGDDGGSGSSGGDENGGDPWTAPAALNTTATDDFGDEDEGIAPSQDWNPQVTSDGAGSLVAVWVSDNPLDDTIGLDWDILAARSTDDGATWTAPAALNTNATSDSGTDMRGKLGGRVGIRRLARRHDRPGLGHPGGALHR
jgi:hypothetical protein